MNLQVLLRDALWPNRCTLCEQLTQGGSLLHDACVDRMPRRPAWTESPRTLAEAPPLLAHFADGPDFFRLLHQIKYGARPLLLAQLARHLVQRLQAMPCLGAGAVLVPLPDDPARRRARGYSITGELAREIARTTSLRLDEALLGRRSGGVAQATVVGAAARRRNQEERWVSGALDRYACDRDLLLVEDQITTGATASAALRRLGSRGHRVACIALASSAAAPSRLPT